MQIPTPTTVLCVIAVGLGSSFQFGYNLGVINVPQTVIQAWMNSTAHTSVRALDVAWSGIVAIWCVGGFIGCHLASLLSDRFGRRSALLVASLPAGISSVLFFCAKVSGWYPILIFARFINGLSCGIHTTVAPVYLMEISPKKLRGSIGAINQLFITIGIALSSTLGLSSILGTAQLWSVLLGMTGVPVLVQLLMLPFCPDTPKYLYLNKDDEARALNALRKLRNPDEVQTELQELSDQKASEETQSRQVAWISFVLQPVLWKPLLICVVMMMANQLSGFSVALYYSTRVLITTGLSVNTAELMTVGFNWVFVVSTVLFLPLVDHVGRKPLMLFGVGVQLLLNILLASFLSYSARWISYVAVVLIVSFMLTTALGPGSIPWLYTSEVFLQSGRVRANSLAAAVNWTFNFLVSLTFLPIHNAIGPLTFLIFAGVLLFVLIVFFFFMPETKGRNVEDIVAGFSGSVVY